jgi:hypothetical protein
VAGVDNNGFIISEFCDLCLTPRPCNYACGPLCTLPGVDVTVARDQSDFDWAPHHACPCPHDEKISGIDHNEDAICDLCCEAFRPATRDELSDYSEAYEQLRYEAQFG